MYSLNFSVLYGYFASSLNNVFRSLLIIHNYAIELHHFSVKYTETAFSTEAFLLQPIWSNKIFNFKGKTICFENWIKSGILYVKDIFEENGTLKSSSDIFGTLRKRTNWLCEYKIIKQIFTKFELKYDFS